MGAILAAGLAALLFGPGHGTHVPVPGPLTRAIGVEAVLTFFLMLVIIAVATDRRVHGAVPGLAIGLTVVFDVLIGGPVTGGSMNPARSLGPALFAGGPALAHLWVYVVGPTLGAVAAAALYELIRGGTPRERRTTCIWPSKTLPKRWHKRGRPEEDDGLLDVGVPIFSGELAVVSIRAMPQAAEKASSPHANGTHDGWFSFCAT